MRGAIGWRGRDADGLNRRKHDLLGAVSGRWLRGAIGLQHSAEPAAVIASAHEADSRERSSSQRSKG